MTEAVDTDILIIGGGLAGLVAALRVRRPEASAALPARVLVLEGERPGGLLNWGGRNAFHIAGPKLKLKDEHWAALTEDAREVGVEQLAEGVVSCQLDRPIKSVLTTSGRTLRAHAVIIASGAFPLKNAARFRRKDGLVTTFGSANDVRATVERLMQKTGRSSLVLMGTETILELARLLSDLSPQVLVDPPYAGALPPRARLGYLERIVGDPKITAVEYVDEQGARGRIECDTVYADFNAYMERTTATRYLAGSGLVLDPKGFVPTDRELATALPGVFAAGDVTGGMFAVSKSIYEGNRAGFSALGWLHRTCLGFEPSFHPFYHGSFSAEIGLFHRRRGAALRVGEGEGAEPPWLEAAPPAGAATRYGLTPELLPLARALLAVEGTFRAETLGVPVDGVSYAVLFELVRVGALGVGHAPHVADEPGLV